VASPEISIRRATTPDLPALQDLLQRYYLEGAVEHTDDEAALRSYTQPSAFGFLIAEIDTEMIGCVLSRTVSSIPAAVECKRLYVAPEARGRGIAALLMDALEDAARAASISWVYLDSKDNFQTAIAMYRRRGYEVCERFNDNPEATIFLRKFLDPPANQK
jgi:N-acetylglutamate synthase-like GNAT family acetyltransferase